MEHFRLTIQNVHVHYGQSHVLQGVNLAIPPGETTAIVGRNGVGKTTLINAVMGLLPLSEGELLLQTEHQRHSLGTLTAPQRKGLGMALVPQGRRLFRSLSVAEHLNLTAPYQPMPYNVEAIFELFPRLRERKRALARTLSGGEQSMLAIARALILNPGLLLMDEPTEGLAPLLVEQIADVVNELSQSGMTILLVEQKLRFALAVAQHIAVMDRGHLIGVYEKAAITDVEALTDLILHGTSQPTSTAN